MIDMKVPVLTQAKENSGEFDLPVGIFDGPVRRHLLYEVVKMQNANRRSGTSSVKTRGTVSGGGKKPWRQKGTGRARAGSSRSPIWTGGAVVHGPQPRSYAYRLPASARRAALRSALALKLKEGTLLVLDSLEVEAKTKFVSGLLATLGLKSALFVTAEENTNLERATRNIPRVKTLRAEGANVYDILRYRHLVVTRETIAALQGRIAR